MTDMTNTENAGFTRSDTFQLTDGTLVTAGDKLIHERNRNGEIVTVTKSAIVKAHVINNATGAEWVSYWDEENSQWGDAHIEDLRTAKMRRTRKVKTSDDGTETVTSVKDSGRLCEACGEPIGVHRGRPSKFCTGCREKGLNKPQAAPKDPNAPKAARKAHESTATPKVPFQGNPCRKCGTTIPPTGKRGRPAVVCDTCKGH